MKMYKTIGVLAVATGLILTGVRAHATIVLNGGFEDPHQTSAIYLSNIPGNFANWVVGGLDVGVPGVGINVASNIITTPAAEGTQYAWLQGRSSLSQTIVLPLASSFNLSFFVGGRLDNGDGYPNTFAVTLSNTTTAVTQTLASGNAPYSSVALVHDTTSFGAPAGTYVLTLLNAEPLDHYRNQTVGFDNVDITAVPEASVALLFGLGGLLIWRKRQALRS